MLTPSSADIEVTKYDLTLAATFLVVSNLGEKYLLDTPLLDEKWQKLALATLIGFAAHGLLTNKLSAYLNDRFKVVSENSKAAVYDIVKFSTVFVAQQVLVQYMEGRPINLNDKRWQLVSALVIAGYVLFDLFVKDSMPNVDKQQPLVNDLVKVSMGALLAAHFAQGGINETNLKSLAALLAGFAVFHLYTKGMVVQPVSETKPETKTA